MSARVQFLAGGLSLIHIPLHLYPHFVQPILRLLFLSEEGRPSRRGEKREAWASSHPFLNISVTPVECSLVCSREHADELFLPLVNALGDVQDQVSITVDDYVVLQVDGVGLDAGRRVVELTAPLALARIPIFFITTYFSDYILVPAKSQGHVSRALEERGFVFEGDGDAFVNHAHPNYYHHGTSSPGSPMAGSPQTPPPSSLAELQLRTFAILRRRNVMPTADPNIRLIQCAGSKEIESDGSSTYGPQLQMGLIRCFVHQPRFLSLTLTDTESASLLMEKSLLRHFDQVNDVLLGSRRDDMLIPITLDLRDLPLESTGIVCGVAGRLVGAIPSTSPPGSPTHGAGYHPTTVGPLHSLVDMSYLSTARAGTVMVAEEELEWAMEVLCEDQHGVHMALT